MKKILVCLLLLALLLSGVVACSDNENIDGESESPSESVSESESESESEEESKENDQQTQPGGTEDTDPDDPPQSATKAIDIFLIAGQSNAAGSTNITNAEALYDLAPELREGYSYIHYSGDSRGAGSATSFSNNEKEWQSVKLGFGVYNGHMGPEVGLAQALSEYYNADTGRHAGIIKMAQGATTLVNGRWASPSYAAALSDSQELGVLYDALISEFETQISSLAAYGGFDKINIVGLYWMQGENDVGKETEYKTAFKYFVSDLRTDLSEVMKKYNRSEDDGGASEMAIFIGSISETFASASASNVARNKQFIQMQSELAQEIDNAYFIDNSKHQVNDANGVVGSDRYHWNQIQCYMIGVRLGQRILWDHFGYVPENGLSWEDFQNWKDLFEIVIESDANGWSENY